MRMQECFQRYLATILVCSLNVKGGRMKRNDRAKRMTSPRKNRLEIGPPFHSRDEIPAVEEAS